MKNKLYVAAFASTGACISTVPFTTIDSREAKQKIEDGNKRIIGQNNNYIEISEEVGEYSISDFTFTSYSAVSFILGMHHNVEGNNLHFFDKEKTFEVAIESDVKSTIVKTDW